PADHRLERRTIDELQADVAREIGRWHRERARAHQVAAGGAVRGDDPVELAHDLHTHLQDLPLLALDKVALSVPAQDEVDAAVCGRAAPLFDGEPLQPEGIAD